MIYFSNTGEKSGVHTKLKDLWLVLSFMVIANLTILLREIIDPIMFLLTNNFSLVIFDLLLLVCAVMLLHLIAAIYLIQKWRKDE